jgi:cellobiose phosphorylase
MTVRESILVDRPPLCRVRNEAGLQFAIFENGTIHSITAGTVRINLFNGSLLSEGICNLYIRKLGKRHQFAPLLGPSANAKYSFTEDRFTARGEFEGIRYDCRLVQDPDAHSWKWEIVLDNTNRQDVRLDLICVQDVGLTGANEGEKNELYTSQYIDYTILDHPEYGPVVCCRQNELGPGCLPWLALGSLDKTAGYSTDGELFYGLDYRVTAIPAGLLNDTLGGHLQKEMAIVALQQEPFLLPAGRSRKLGFFGIFCTHHPDRTGPADLPLIDARLHTLNEIADESAQMPAFMKSTAESLFSASPLFVAEDLTERDLDLYFKGPRRHCEVQEGHLLSFFHGENTHVVMKAKELQTDRPCGHILKTGCGFDPDESVMGCTSFMFGVFQSHLTQGNVNFNRFLSVHTDPLNVQRHTGQRIFIYMQGQYQQLGVPSAFAIEPGQCRWLYKQGNLLFEVKVSVSPEKPKTILQITVLEGPPCRWIIIHHLVEENGWYLKEQETIDSSRILRFVPADKSRPGKKYPNGRFELGIDNLRAVQTAGGDENVFTDGRSRGLPCVSVEYQPCKSASITITGRLIPPVHSEKKSKPFRIASDPVPSKSQDSGLAEILEILPWFTHNAQIHYLLPHGLEQYGGAAWGTRDICQGPVEMLLAMGQYDPVRKILRTVFSNQNPDGNWPQWWMFDRYHTIRALESHGDVIFWPILAACEYIDRSGDMAFLEESLPFYSTDEGASVLDHILRAFEHVRSKRLTAGTWLVDFSDGDWNDALQPVDPAMKKKLISSWMVELSYQAAAAFAGLCRKVGLTEKAETFEQWSRWIRADFLKYLMADSVVPGFGIIKDNKKMDLLMHPSSKALDIHYRLLPMTRGILSGLFSPEQAARHLALIERHLTAPDGVRLMDRPLPYEGGLQRYFRRAESSPFFGREIGLMYTHAHLRYAEALSVMGQSEGFLNALRKAVPINIQAVIPTASRRQSNCYFSSSDAAFGNRYEVNQRYADLLGGKIKFNGGWRIYSSGPGIFMKLVISHLLGIRCCHDRIEIDPVMPHSLDGLSVVMDLYERPIQIRYRVCGKGKGVRRIEINGEPVPFSRALNLYRLGAAVIDRRTMESKWQNQKNTIKIDL